MSNNLYPSLNKVARRVNEPDSYNPSNQPNQIESDAEIAKKLQEKLNKEGQTSSAATSTTNVPLDNTLEVGHKMRLN